MSAENRLNDGQIELIDKPWVHDTATETHISQIQTETYSLLNNFIKIPQKNKHTHNLCSVNSFFGIFRKFHSHKINSQTSRNSNRDTYLIA